MILNLLLITQMNIEEYNPNKKRKTPIVFDDMIADMRSNKKLNPRVTKLFIRGRKQFFCVPKNIRLNSTNYFVMKIPNKKELQKTAINHSSEIFIKHVLQNHIRY